jgi:hypothetical protein
MNIVFREATVAGALAMLVGCGGAGDAQPAGAGMFDADAAFAHALAGAALSGLRAADSQGAKYTASLTYAVLPEGDFYGNWTRRSLQTTTIGRTGEPADVSRVTIFYDTRPARAVGTVADGGKTTVFTQVAQIPTAAEVGWSGVFAEGMVYATPALGAPVGTETLLWSIEPDSGATALACLTSISRSGDWVSSEKDCFRIDGAGNLSGGEIRVHRPGLALHFVQQAGRSSRGP